MFGRQYGLEDEFTAKTYLKMLLLVKNNEDQNVFPRRKFALCRNGIREYSRESSIQLLSDVLNLLDGTLARTSTVGDIHTAETLERGIEGGEEKE